MSRVKPNADDKAYIDNYPPLRDFLARAEAHCVWQVRGPNKSYLEGWMLGARLVIIQVFPNKMGWQIWTASKSNSASETLAEVAEHCDLPLPHLRWSPRATDRSRPLGSIEVDHARRRWLVVAHDSRMTLLARMLDHHDREPESALECAGRCREAIRETLKHCTDVVIAGSEFR
jgi:hypothetical protein